MPRDEWPPLRPASEASWRFCEKLRFSSGTLRPPLRAISRRALARKTGARGLRSILETVLLDTMYELPTLENVSKVVVDEQMISADGKPLLIYSDQHKVAGGSSA